MSSKKLKMGFGFHGVEPFVFILTTVLVASCHGYLIGKNPHHRAFYLDSQGNYYLEWRVDFLKNLITFNVTAGTTGYVLFGLANNGIVTTGGDYVIAGVLENGENYLSDRHTLKNEVPREDASEDYKLLGAWENKTHTTISFSRALDTCDRFDYPLTDNKVTVIWGYGLTDDYDLVKPYGVQGAVNVYLLDPDYSPRIGRDRRLNGAPSVVTKDDLQVWTIRRQIVIPENTTSYICSIHRGPRLQKKHHMIGKDVYFHSQGSRRRVHHVLVYKCNSPRGEDPRTVFDSFEGTPGQTCYSPQLGGTSGSLPTYLCTELFTGWAIGGRSYFTPPHVGYPIGQQKDEYYMVQVHYDNPEGRKGVIVDMRLDFFYTSYLRPNDAGMLGVGNEIPGLPPSILVPPLTTSQRIFTHCPGECTGRITPESGLKVFATHLHSHKSGKRLRLRHFRGDQELPWIMYDDNYDNNYQETRHLREEKRVLPGDQLTMECIYDNTWTNGTVVGGYSTSQEMCYGFLHYYSRINDYSYCRSEIVSEEYRQKFLGISNVTWNEDLLEYVVVTPQELRGLTITQVSDNHVNWDEKKRQELIRFHESHPQISRCSRDMAYRTSPNDDYSGPSGYPFRAGPYVPKLSCSYKDEDI